MRAVLTEILPGSYSVVFDQFDITLLDAHKDSGTAVHFIAAEIATALGLSLTRVDVWDAVRNDDDHIVDDVTRAGEQAPSTFSWHNDAESEFVNVIMLVYFVDAPLTKDTGGRIEFQHVAATTQAACCNIYDADVYLQIQDESCKHRVEPYRDIPSITKRLVFSIKLWGVITPSSTCSIVRPD